MTSLLILSQLRKHKRIASDPSYLTLGTGHPNGRQRPLSRDPARGVVDPGFKVHGYASLLCLRRECVPDQPLTVNPQLTVMSLAHYAVPADRVTGMYTITPLTVIGVLLVYAALFLVITRALRS